MRTACKSRRRERKVVGRNGKSPRPARAFRGRFIIDQTAESSDGARRTAEERFKSSGGTGALFSVRRGPGPVPAGVRRDRPGPFTRTGRARDDGTSVAPYTTAHRVGGLRWLGGPRTVVRAVRSYLRFTRTYTCVYRDATAVMIRSRARARRLCGNENVHTHLTRCRIGDAAR